MYNYGTVTKMHHYSSKEKCESVVERNKNFMPPMSELHCIQIEVSTKETSASEIELGDVINLPNGKSGAVTNKHIHPSKKDFIMVEFSSKESRGQLHRVFLKPDEKVLITN